MWTLYISEILGPQNSLVFSVETPSPISVPDLTFSDSIPAKIVIADGSGSVSAASGAVGSTVTVSIGQLNDAEWSNLNWTRDTTAPAGWTGAISPSGDDLFALFQGRSEMVLAFQVKVTDASGNPRTYLSMPVRVLASMAPAGTIASMRDGQFSIPNGVDSVDVTGLGLPAVPRRVLVNIQKPDGGGNIFATVLTSSVSTDGFNVDLSAATDMDGYTLEYQLIFG